MIQTCSTCQQAYELRDQDLAFYAKMGLPPRRQCFACATRQKFLFRNYFAFYHRDCDRCRKDIISMYRPEAPATVWCEECYASDALDAAAYAQEYDAVRPFLEQAADLYRRVPQRALLNYGENPGCDYCNSMYMSKDCYLVFCSSEMERCYYCHDCFVMKDSAECFKVMHSELCYEVTFSDHCYNLAFAERCEDVRDSAFMAECKHCNDCMFCVQLEHKSYCIRNTQYTKEEYERIKASFDLGSHAALGKMKAEFAAFMQSFPRLAADIRGSENCTGDNIGDAKDCYMCFDLDSEIQDCAYLIIAVQGARGVYDGNNCGLHLEHSCNILGVAQGVYGIVCSMDIIQDCRDLWYCIGCWTSHDLLGCVGLRHAEYRILNKQYTPEEYHALRAQILEKMRQEGTLGDFFPISMCPFSYNETSAQNYYPTDEAGARTIGAMWLPEGAGPTSAKGREMLADHVRHYAAAARAQELSESVVESTSGELYRIIPQELALHLQQGIALPRESFRERNSRRINSRPPYELREEQCACCQAAVTTPWPAGGRQIYCAACYQVAVGH